MNIAKRLLKLDRQRCVPAHFSWIDHRLVREHYIEKVDVCAWARYLFLITVADAQGLSYDGDAQLSKRLRLVPPDKNAVCFRSIFIGRRFYPSLFPQLLHALRWRTDSTRQIAAAAATLSDSPPPGMGIRICVFTACITVARTPCPSLPKTQATGRVSSQE